MEMKTIRIRATGQVTEMAPHVATAMILGGTAEEVKSAKGLRLETMTLPGGFETAVAPAQSPSRKRAR
jgi:hypothetical protein